MTGAAIPESCDCMIRQESVTIVGEKIFVAQKLRHHENFYFAARTSNFISVRKLRSRRRVTNFLSSAKKFLPERFTTATCTCWRRGGFSKIGKRIFLRLLMKPGAPVITLNGNPFAAYVTFELLTRPILAKMSRRKEILYRRGRGTLMNDFPKKVSSDVSSERGSTAKKFSCRHVTNRAIHVGDEVEIILI